MREPLVESMTEVRNHLARVVDRASREGISTIVTRRGVPEAAVVAVDEYRHLRNVEARLAEASGGGGAAGA